MGAFDLRDEIRHHACMNEDEIVVDAEAAENARAQDVDETDTSRADAKAEKKKDELSVCRAERQEYLDGWQRAKADYVNVLRRLDEEKKTSETRGITKALQALLPAVDALTRAKEHGDVPEGFAAIARQLEGAFQSLGLESFGVVGEAFNPVFHEALGQDTVDTKEKDDTVTTVFEQGWKCGEQVIRPAKVRVGTFVGA